MEKELASQKWSFHKTHPIQHPNLAKVCDDINCFNAESTWSDIGGVKGYWTLDTPIELANIIGSGSNPRITRISSKGMALKENAYHFLSSSELGLVVDGGQIWQKSIKYHPKDEWKLNEWKEEIDLTGNTQLNLKLYQFNVVNIGWVSWRDGYLAVEGDFYTTIPPPTTDVEVGVVDMAESPIKGANVKIMSGTQVLANGNTDENGTVLFNNVQDGGYTIKIYKSGYILLDSRIDVQGGSMLQYFYLVPTGGIVLPFDVKWLILGGAVIGGVYLLKQTTEPVRRVRGYTQQIKRKGEQALEYIRR